MFYFVVGLAAFVFILFMMFWGGSIEKRLDEINANLKRIANALDALALKQNQ